MKTPLSDAYFRSLKWENDSTFKWREWTRSGDCAFIVRKYLWEGVWLWRVKGGPWMEPDDLPPQTIEEAVEMWPDHTDPSGTKDYMDECRLEGKGDLIGQEAAERAAERIRQKRKRPAAA